MLLNMSKAQFSQFKWLLSLFIFPSLTFSTKVLAHNTQVIYEKTEAIQITAVHDTGEPLTQAQVVIYAPEDPTTPWLKGETDDEGRFTFIPDSNQSGNWDVKVRKAGHGDIVSIPIGNTSSNDMTVESPPIENGDSTTRISSPGETKTAQAEYTSLQKLVMAASGVWGLIGTALFFSRSNKR